MTATNTYFLRLSFLMLFSPILGCQKKSAAQHQTTAVSFASTPLSTQIKPGSIDEASGIADHTSKAGYLWVNQDSGNPNDIFLLSYTGDIFKTINIKHAVNRDWEDMAVANGPEMNGHYIYLADIGDNNKVFSEYSIYRFPEPDISIDTVFAIDRIRFRYPDGPHDAEAILVDRITRDIYVITKRDTASRIYRLPYPQDISSVNTAVYTGSLPFNGVVSAASSIIGDELLIKTYSSLYYWKRSGTESISETLAKPATKLGYQPEPQGEAVCFKNDNGGFYTLSEKPLLISAVSLNFYQRK